TVSAVSSRSATTTSAPSSAKRTQHARPMPLAPPVTTATRPCKRSPMNSLPEQRLRDDEHAELGLQLLPRLRSQRLPLEASVAEQRDERDRLDLVRLLNVRTLVDVDLHDLVRAAAHRRDLLDDRFDL